MFESKFVMNFCRVNKWAVVPPWEEVDPEKPQKVCCPFREILLLAYNSFLVFILPAFFSRVIIVWIGSLKWMT